MLPLYGALIASYHKRWRGAGVFFSFALSVKMNILLYAPVLALLVVLENGLSEAFAVMAVIVLVQVPAPAARLDERNADLDAIGPPRPPLPPPEP
jgi:uncharacterized membrane protein